MTRRLRRPWVGMAMTAVVGVLMAIPTAIEYAVMLAGISLNAID